MEAITLAPRRLQGVPLIGDHTISDFPDALPPLEAVDIPPAQCKLVFATTIYSSRSAILYNGKPEKRDFVEAMVRDEICLAVGSIPINFDQLVADGVHCAEKVFTHSLHNDRDEVGGLSFEDSVIISMRQDDKPS